MTDPDADLLRDTDLDPVTVRIDYQQGSLYAAELDPDPVVQFRHWLAAAAEAGIREPNAMTLATAGAEGAPSARIVLLRGVDARGFTWYTNRESLKGRDLAANPRAALVFHWESLERQVRVSGPVRVIDESESAAYFAGRPRKSQLSAWASPQGRPLAGRDELVAATERIAARYPGDVPLPPFWGGYRLSPEMVEFWQGRRSRMHDRFAYLREADGWRIERLAP
jgi:pyridoxamine 5'-phosphate oxidase